MVLSVTRLSTGDGAVNVIPERVEIAATVRNMSPASLTTLQDGLPRVVEGVASSEDFAFVLAEVPGTFIALMTSPEGTDLRTVEWNHSPRVVFDDSVLGD